MSGIAGAQTTKPTNRLAMIRGSQGPSWSENFWQVRSNDLRRLASV
jgi:hypothetical protein